MGEKGPRMEGKKTSDSASRTEKGRRVYTGGSAEKVRQRGESTKVQGV